MSLSIRALNNDTSFLLTFSPPGVVTSGSFPGSFTILIDPWLSGSAQIFSSKFSLSKHTHNPCVSSLTELPEPDLILISQDKPDHCHQETLTQLHPHTESTILGTAAAARKIRSWSHFSFATVLAMRKYDPRNPTTIYRILIPPISPSGSSGEVTITYMAAKHDITRLHNAIGITYRPPTTVLSNTYASSSYLNLVPLTPPDSPSSIISRPLQSPSTPLSTATTIVPSPFPVAPRERTLSVLYSPHGIPYAQLAPWASSHLVSASALPLTALIHAFDSVDNPWYLGGNITVGCPGGVEIAEKLMPRVWISAHDEEKEVSGVSVKRIRTRKFGVDEVTALIGKREEEGYEKDGLGTEVVCLGSGGVWGFGGNSKV
ncbi:hypothetical protein K402DRAFT_392441 [Aulographum hederae CBS 113979]|uniref:Metallo-beta-lactamase domain-containing protein n=1 Tax=Aulographum hederae CBS 113979 TaxID=1176131 RepID=A0A6G1H3N0_9PEZI|nr:hypothetical protein K402DRAFT_392441 [Aulographum hederae CBS 113979]